MPAPSKGTELLDLVRKSGLLESQRIDGYVTSLEKEGPVEPDPGRLASRLVRDGLITIFQARQMLRGRYRGFFLGKYKVLEPIGSGGMADVYLCEHTAMKHKVAVKILPIEKLKDPSLLGRFKREAQAIAALNHPNVVRAFDLDNEGSLHYLVTEYVDGCNLQDFIKKNGPLDPARAANYIAQAAAGLQHIYEAGLVHRDIKPGNLLLDRSGVVKLLDLGLARFSDIDRQDGLTKQFDDGRVLGTADYIAPEQSIRGSDVDIRADIYSLGATFYFMLKGEAPFEGATVTQKLLFHQIKDPPALGDHIPADIINLLHDMMAKKPEARVQTPEVIVEALLNYASYVMPPHEEEMPPRASSLGAAKAGPKSSARMSGRVALAGTSGVLVGPNSSGRLTGPLSGTLSGRINGPRSGIDQSMKPTPHSGIRSPIAPTIPEVVYDDDDLPPLPQARPPMATHVTGQHPVIPAAAPARYQVQAAREEETLVYKYRWHLVGATIGVLVLTIIVLLWVVLSNS
jgi:serine/threonine protein kinase